MEVFNFDKFLTEEKDEAEEDKEPEEGAPSDDNAQEEKEDDKDADDNVEEPEDEEPEDEELSEPIKAAITDVLIDFETKARNDAKEEQEMQVESRSLAKLLYENEDIDTINLETFASELVRLIKNYDTLLDMEALLVKEAQAFLRQRYDEDVVDALTNILSDVYDITIENVASFESDANVPLAIGAHNSGGIQA